MKNKSDSNSLLLVIKRYKLVNLHAENRLLYFILITLLCLNSTFADATGNIYMKTSQEQK